MVVRAKIITTVEQSLDAALVGGIMQSDKLRGRLYVDEYQGQCLARQFFKEGLKLNNQLENDNLKDTSFRVTFQQNEEQPKISAEVSTVITAMSPKALGLDGLPIRIRKTQYQLGKFK